MSPLYPLDANFRSDLAFNPYLNHFAASEIPSLEYLRLSGSSITTLNVSNNVNLKELHVNENKLTTDAPFRDCSICTQLVSIDIRGLPHLEYVTLSTCRSLTYLDYTAINNAIKGLYGDIMLSKLTLLQMVGFMQHLRTLLR